MGQGFSIAFIPESGAATLGASGLVGSQRSDRAFVSEAVAVAVLTTPFANACHSGDSVSYSADSAMPFIAVPGHLSLEAEGSAYFEAVVERAYPLRQLVTTYTDNGRL